MIDTPTTASSRGASSVGLFLISAAILALEVLHVRVLAAQMWYHHAFVVVTMAMLGFAAAGTVVTIVPQLTQGDVSARLAWASTLFGVTVTVGHLLLTRTADAVTTVSATGEFGLLAVAYALLMVPYFFGGLVVTLALSTAERVHTRYFVNLIGSALGAWLFVATIRPLGAERLLVLCAAAGPLSALCFGGRTKLPRVVAALALAVAAALFVGNYERLAVNLGLGKRNHLTGVPLEHRWTPLCRLDLHADSLAQTKVIHIVQDGGAGTSMQAAAIWVPPALMDTHAVAYIPHLRRMRAGGPPPDALVIGVGGGTDLRLALEYGAKSVMGIEINAEIVRLVERDYAAFIGNLVQKPGVSVVAGEGRSTLRRLDRKFDLIQIAGADTYTAGVVGSFVLSESYLYTQEALRDYLDHLTQGGTLGIIRFFDEPDREALRLFGMTLLELRRRGVEQPSRHAVVIRTQWSSGMVCSLEPFAPEDIATYFKADKDPAGLHSVIYAPGLATRRENAFTRLAAAIDERREDAFYEGYVVDVRPVSDDSPFFFNFHHFWDRAEIEDSAYARSLDSRIPVAPGILRGVLIECTILVVVLVLLPLWILRRRGLRGTGSTRHLCYFLALGAGFMLLEISSIQRLALFLGHPIYSLTVVLFSFLLFAGLGSVASGRFLRDDARTSRAVLLVLALLIGLFTLTLDLVTEHLLALSLPLRIAVAIACLAPMNLVMGMPFPRGLALLKRSRPELVPWAIGANGGASVIASVVAIIIAMESGFTVVAVVALACYLVALFSVTSKVEPARSSDRS